MSLAQTGFDFVTKYTRKREFLDEMDLHIAMIPCKGKTINKSNPVNVLREQMEKLKVNIRAKVEYPFRVIKCQFGHLKTRNRELAKNTSQLLGMFALSNI